MFVKTFFKKLLQTFCCRFIIGLLIFYAQREVLFIKKKFSFAFTFCGCFLGAGFISGQELWQFFGAFGLWGYLGLALAMVLTALCGMLILKLARKGGFQTMDRMIVPWKHSAPFRHAVGAVQFIFLLGVTTIMAAGAGALLHSLWSLPRWSGALLLLLPVGVASLFGTEGLIRIFDYLVPILTTLTVVISGCLLVRNGFSAPSPQPTGNPLLSNFILSAVTFVCYNLFSAFGVLIPLAHREPKPLAGTLLGCGVLLLIALAVLLPIGSHSTAELPMLEAAASLHPLLKYVYGLLLLAAMFAAGLTCTAGCLQFAKRPKRLLPFCLAFCFAGSLIGFGDLIGTVYPLAGYLSLFGIISMLIYYIRSRKNGTETI